MPITFGQAKEILSQYAGRGGKCPTDEGVALFVRQVLDYMLISGEYGNLRKFTFMAVKGCITTPYELEAPLKVKIDGCVGTAWDKWFEFHPGRWQDVPGCLPADNALFEEAEYYPTVYDVPQCGARIGCIGTVDEHKDAHLIVKGEDPTGRVIYTSHQGEQVVGEYISIKKGNLTYTQATFGKITSIIKTPTIGYVPLYWITPDKNLKGYLADYPPTEEIPQYRRFRLTAPGCSQTSKVTVLGRIRLKPHYADNDVIPFDNLYALNLAGQAINSNYNDNVQVAQAKDANLRDIISRENEHKRVQNGQPVEFFLATSGGAITNIVTTNAGAYGYGFGRRGGG